jgi:very-short-patch-repair endonuclease
MDAKLIIEVDGASHDYTEQEDAVRPVFFEAQGFTVLCFTNEQVLTEI